MILKLGKYLKPYLPAVLFSILLLFIQANADLALPDYMSKIVNTGIQQGGIDSSVPVAMSEDGMSLLKLFMTDEDIGTVESAYVKTEVNTDVLIETYPAAESENIYLLRSVDETLLDELSHLMAPALIAAGNIDKMPIPEGADPAALLSAMSSEQRLMILEQMTSSIQAMSPTMIEQAAVSSVKAEYDALGMDTASIQHKYILRIGGQMLLLTLVAAFCTIIVGFLASRVAAGFSRDLRSSIFEKVENFSSREFDKFSTASLITRSTNDITQLQMVIVMLIRMVFYAPIIGVGGIIRAIGKNSSMWWVIASAVGALSLIVIFMYFVAIPKFKLMQKLVDRLNLVSREGLSGMLVIRAFNMQPHEEKRFEKANSDLTDNTLFVNRIMVFMMPLMMLIMNGLSLIIIWVGAHQIADSAMQVGDMMAFLQYAMQIVMSFLMMSMMFIMLPRAAVSAVRIAEVIETEPTINDPEKPENFDDNFKPEIVFDNVSFKYPGAPENVLDKISFTAKPGQTTAVIGATGSGKSTLVNLIPRFYDVTEGTIKIDGLDIRHLTQHDLRDKIGFVPQKSTLFSGTVESNLKYADENASVDFVADAAEVAQAAEFISKLDDGFDSPVSQGGSNLSGGQKQRLSIARALVKKPPVYIFDDSFSALDYKTDSALREALASRTENSTVIIVTQRVATVMSADQIIVMEDGRVEGIGTHRDLMENCETYREIATSQLSLEELQ